MKFSNIDYTTDGINNLFAELQKKKFKNGPTSCTELYHFTNFSP